MTLWRERDREADRETQKERKRGRDRYIPSGSPADICTFRGGPVCSSLHAAHTILPQSAMCPLRRCWRVRYEGLHPGTM